MTASASGARAGTMFGPYELQSLLGVGGMGEVYRAYDTAKDRTVALKLLRAELSADAGYQERFKRESRVAAKLQEPHVIPVHDFGEINGVLFIDMRCVDGHDLKAVLRAAGPLEPARAVSIVSQVAAALDAAHANGLVHRDIKPENVLLTDSDFAYLVDFGIAHLGDDTGLTSAGAAIGSCAYMAPERFTGGEVGPAADVYSLACLLYECLTGETPFPTGELSQLMGSHVMAPPPRPSEGRPYLNDAFDAVIARGMAKKPEARFASAGELSHAAAAALGSTADTRAGAATTVGPTSGPMVTRQFVNTAPNPTAGTTPGPPVPPRGFGRGRWLAVAAVLVIFATAGGVAAWLVLSQKGSEPTAPPPSPATTPPEVTSATTSRAAIALPGTDAQGFLAYPAARCDPDTTPAVLARTTQSVFVVCRAGPGDFYYRGVRLSDGATIELADAVRSSGGFDITNPTDGTHYQIRPDRLTIVTPDGQEVNEPVVEYASI
jgi:Protein kinase domain